jgi:hypothetical protein
MRIMKPLHFAILVLVARQTLILVAVLRSCRFLFGKPCQALPSPLAVPAPVFYIVIPALREAAGLRQTAEHFRALANKHIATVIVVTTAREMTEADRHADCADTIAVAKEIAREGHIVHLHYPDPQGLKGDQINFAADHCIKFLLGDTPTQQAFLLVYDADSRPPLDSLTRFKKAIETHQHVSVFHQSSRFELRASPISTANSTVMSRLLHAAVDSGALRANRFVLGFEIPRLLNRSDNVAAWRRRLNSCVYAHVTGHGLCLRISLLQELRLPARSPLEDMHYSFLLGSRNLPMVPIRSLDCAEVPQTMRVQFNQLARWFFGPARFIYYSSDPSTLPGLRAYLLATSAAGITAGWLSCAILPLLLAYLICFGDGLTTSLTGGLLIIYAVQLIIVDKAMSDAACQADRIFRLLMYPITFTMFGIAGISGLIYLFRGDSGAGKTERA